MQHLLGSDSAREGRSGLVESILLGEFWGGTVALRTFRGYISDVVPRGKKLWCDVEDATCLEMVW
jgi:hypothetical protein